MATQITLPRKVRIFKRAYGKDSRMLCQAQRCFEKGTTILVGFPCSMSYDHGDRLAVPIIDIEDGKEELFLLASEIGALNAVI